MTRLRHAVLVVAILVLAAGCLGSFGVSDDGDSGDDIEGESVGDAEELSQATLLDGIDAVESYEFELHQTMELPDESVEMTAEGAFDEADEKLAMDIDMGMPGMEIESYLVDDTMYMNIFGEWLQSDVSDEETVSETETLDDQADIIDDSEFEEVGTEEINGVETTVLELDLGEEAIAALEDDEVDVTETVEYRLFVDESTGYLHKVEMELVMESAGETVATEMEMVISNHNEPVDITLPEAAEEATEIDDFDDPYGTDGGY